MIDEQCGVDEVRNELRERIQHDLNVCSAENDSDTPDFILAQYLMDCLAAFDRAVALRTKWYRPDVMLEKERPDDGR